MTILFAITRELLAETITALEPVPGKNMFVFVLQGKVYFEVEETTKKAEVSDVYSVYFPCFRFQGSI